ncbi:hypothetical protein [Aquimarina hainanensis]|uniref:hypothetical protein n=1 Tax=Aquimarina hainanensis TaxID=1578017 RepID=UPI0036203D4B
MVRNPELLQNRKQYIEWVIQHYSKTEPTKQITTIVRELSRWHLFVSERSIWRELKS